MLGKCISLSDYKNVLHRSSCIGFVFQGIIRGITGGTHRRVGLVSVTNLNSNTQYLVLIKLLQGSASTTDASIESDGNMS
jgi:hypothetical protein